MRREEEELYLHLHLHYPKHFLLELWRHRWFREHAAERVMRDTQMALCSVPETSRLRRHQLQTQGAPQWSHAGTALHVKSMVEC